MIVGALKTKNRVFHYPNCTYALKINPENLISFSCKDDARACGYRHCKYCSRIIKYYNQNKEEIDRFISSNHLKMYIEDDSMYIDNNFACWKITVDSYGNGLVLFHGNTERYEDLKIKDGHIIHHYHLQKYKGNRNIMSMLQYIIDHDKWKAEHINNYKSLPKKTKRQKREYKKAARMAKRTKITNLYNTLYKIKLEKDKI